LTSSYSLLFFAKSDSDDAIALLDPLAKVSVYGVMIANPELIQDTSADSEAIFRCLVGLGTALSISADETKTAATQVFGIKDALKIVKGSYGREVRIQQVITEIDTLLS